MIQPLSYTESAKTFSREPLRDEGTFGDHTGYYISLKQSGNRLYRDGAKKLTARWQNPTNTDWHSVSANRAYLEL